MSIHTEWLAASDTTGELLDRHDLVDEYDDDQYGWALRLSSDDAVVITGSVIELRALLLNLLAQVDEVIEGRR